MWTLGQKAAKYNRLPSSFFPDLVDELTIYGFDNAILWFCTTIENALNERKDVKVGKRTESRQVYQLEDLLDDDFRLPRPPSKLQKRQQGAMSLLALGQDPGSGVKMWRELRPAESPLVQPLGLAQPVKE